MLEMAMWTRILSGLKVKVHEKVLLADICTRKSTTSNVQTNVFAYFNPFTAITTLLLNIL